MRNFKNNLKNIIRLSKSDFMSRYAGNYLGVIWAFLYPCITVVLYCFVFESVLSINASGDAPYVLWLVSALVPYLFFCDCILGTASVLIDYSYLVKKVRFKLIRLPLIRIASHFFIHIIFIALLIVLSIIFKRFPHPYWIMLIYYVIAELIYCIAIGYILAAITVFIRDLRAAVVILSQLGYWLTPIFWDFSLLSPTFRRILVIINPISYISDGFRYIFTYQALPSGFISQSVCFWCVTAILLVLGTLLFKRLSPRIPDHL